MMWHYLSVSGTSLVCRTREVALRVDEAIDLLLALLGARVEVGLHPSAVALERFPHALGTLEVFSLHAQVLLEVGDLRGEISDRRLGRDLGGVKGLHRVRHRLQVLLVGSLRCLREGPEGDDG